MGSIAASQEPLARILLLTVSRQPRAAEQQYASLRAARDVWVLARQLSLHAVAAAVTVTDADIVATMNVATAAGLAACVVRPDPPSLPLFFPQCCRHTAATPAAATVGATPVASTPAVVAFTADETAGWKGTKKISFFRGEKVHDSKKAHNG